MAKQRATFCKIAATGKWAICVSGDGEVKVGDEFSIRKADKTTTTVMVAGIVTKHAGGTVCSIIERRTVSAPGTGGTSALTAGQRAFMRANGGDYAARHDGYERADGFDDDFRGRRA